MKAPSKDDFWVVAAFSVVDEAHLQVGTPVVHTHIRAGRSCAQEMNVYGSWNILSLRKLELDIAEQ